MPDARQLPYLLSLMDDDSPDVQAAVENELLSFGPRLRGILKELPEQLVREKSDFLNPVVYRQQARWLRQHWTDCLDASEDVDKLEQALTMLADYLGGARFLHAVSVRRQLDKLAAACRRQYAQPTALQLAAFLFRKYKLQGVEDEMELPQHSNLYYVLNEKRGSSVSLCCIFMLVGRRLGLTIEGYNFPGHFMSRVCHQNDTLLVDCFHGGTTLREEDVAHFNIHTRHAEAPLTVTTSVEGIIRQVLGNLVSLFQARGEVSAQSLMKDLFAILDDRQIADEVFRTGELSEDNATDPLLASGQQVFHKRYGYRGIIVDFDFHCKADDSWYFSNATHPFRHQPWYYVLVDGTEQVTYAAESNLVPDDKDEPVRHPLLEYFFTRDDKGGYRRNDNPWPK